MQAAAARVGEAFGAPLHLRIGVNSGEVVVGDGSTTLVTGDAVTTAKRLEERAADGEPSAKVGRHYRENPRLERVE